MKKEHLVSAYSRTIYACPGRDVKLLHDQNNSILDEIMLKEDCEELCIITAYNPFSEIITDLENVRRQLKLKAKLDWLGYTVWEGVNRASDGDFPDEATWWVLGMGREEGRELGREWEQNAILHYCRGGKAELVWCR